MNDMDKQLALADGDILPISSSIIKILNTRLADAEKTIIELTKRLEQLEKKVG